MKKFIIAGLIWLAACGKEVRKPDMLPGIPLEIDPSIAVQAANGSAGHACPVNGGVYSADHVFWDGNLRSYVQAAWSDGYGNEGYAKVIGGHTALDFVILEISGTPRYLPAGIAEVGEKVFWFEYDLRTRRDALRPRRRFANVLRIVAKHYILDQMPVEGASGTCLLNSRGEAIGLVVAGWDTDDELGVGSALAFPSQVYESTP